MRCSIPLTMVVAGLLFLTNITALLAADWPHWQGPLRNGHSPEKSGWSGADWPAQQPLWTGQVGAGSTSPLVVTGKLYTLGWRDNKDHLVCLEANTGKTLWTVSYACPPYSRHRLGDENFYSGPTATPEFDAETGYLYTLSTDGDLQAWDTTAPGKRVWGLNLLSTYAIPRRPEVGKKGTRRDYGYVTAPIVHGDWLIVAVGAREGLLMAFDKRTGARRWVSQSKEPAGHCGGLTPLRVAGIPCLAVLSLRKLVVVRLDGDNAGQTVAEYDWTTDFGNNIASPAVSENFVLLTSAYNRQALCKLEITLGGARRVWEKQLVSGACTPVIHKGHIYWAWQKLYCVDFATGQEKWSGGQFGYAGSCLVTADDKLIVWGERGKLVLVEPAERSPGAYRELARRTRLGKAEAWPHVVLADGKLFCKDREGNLTCFRLMPSR